MKIDRISWYLNRLKAMSIPEVKHRIERKIKMDRESKIYKKCTYINENRNIDTRNIFLFEERLEKILSYSHIDIENYKINEDIKVFNDTLNIMEKINWHKGTVSDWDCNKYSNYMNFKNTDDIGDIRYTWEINRHLFFPKLALNFKKSNNKQYIRILETHFYSWIKENPYLKGVNWASPMEIAIRSYQWIVTYSIIKDDISESFKLDIINSIVNSIKYVRENYSLYSSANNHLIVEAVYCGIVGYIVEPIYENRYLEESYRIIEKEILLQNYSDGVNKEQATHYHAFVLDAFLQYAFFLNMVGKKFPNENILFKMSEFIGLLNQSGEVIEFGDSDDAKLIDFNLETEKYYEYVLQLASCYFDTKFLEINKLFEEVKYISHKKEIKYNKHIYKNFYIYEKGGYGIFNLKNEFMLFDIGNLGFGAIAAHGHADALSIVYSKNKKRVFVDSGTYIYNVESKWRNYFRSTFSHNTLILEDISQSQIKGPFLWGKKANAKILDYGENENLMYICASHDGYGPKIHKRCVTYIKNEEIFIIKDKFENVGNVNYILDNKLSIQKLSNMEFKLKNLDTELFIVFNSKAHETKKWISKKFMEKSKTRGINIKHNFDKNGDLYTIISNKRLRLEKNRISLEDYYIEYKDYNYIRRDYDKNC